MSQFEMSLTILVLIIVTAICTSYLRNPFAYMAAVEEAKKIDLFTSTYKIAYARICKEMAAEPVAPTDADYPSAYNARRLQAIAKAMNQHKHMLVLTRCRATFTNTVSRVEFEVTLINPELPLDHEFSISVKRMSMQPNQFRDLMHRLEPVYRMVGAEDE